MNALAMLLMTAVLWTPASAADVSGVWDLEMRWPGDRQSTGVCSFQQDDGKLTGTCGGDDKFTLTGEVDNRRVTWSFAVEQNGNKGRMTFSGELNEAATTITGSCRIEGGLDGTFTMKKQR
jgi:hypothetical protein